MGIKQYFGSLSRHDNPTGMVTREEMKRKQLELEQKLRAEFTAMFTQQLASLNLPTPDTNTQPPPVRSPIRASTKGSCDVIGGDLSGEDIDNNIQEQCELYIDEVPLRVVAIGKVYKLGSTIHHKTLQDDMLRVVVEQVQDANARVPVPTEEVKKVGEAPNHFLQWPKRLVKVISIVSFLYYCFSLT